ncbi:MAG: hypothetical protein MJZ33_02370 [Paludibacteraceae bacterium]|nr:hypothetical protein [Paludibacteraceae bacterium]
MLGVKNGEETIKGEFAKEILRLLKSSTKERGSGKKRSSKQSVKKIFNYDGIWE